MFYKPSPYLRLILIVCCCLTLSASVLAEGPRMVRLAQNPSIAPDGQSLVFAWLGEIWTADTAGAQLKRLTNHQADDSQPLFSPDGKQIAFVSRRTGAPQIFVIPTLGGEPQQITFHSAGYALQDWFPDGKSILATGQRDHFYRDADRLIKIDVTQRRAQEVLCDAMVKNAKLSPDGNRVLFTREGERWWRKGYQGERASQVWLLELESGKFSEILHEGVECMWPVWMPDGKGFYFTKGTPHGFDLWRYRFPKNKDRPGKQKQIAAFDDDSIVTPSIARDGSRILFRHLFDLYTWDVASEGPPQKIELRVAGDVELPSESLRREFSQAQEVAFTQDGLEMALVAGGDVWVIDTKLREPQRVTSSGGYEADLRFSLDGNEIVFTSVADGKTDIWKATRKDEGKFWWQNTEFQLQQLTDDMHVESELRFTPDGKSLVFQQGRGNLVVLDLETKQKRMLVEGFSGIDFDLSADSRWIAYSTQDDDFNSEIWVTALSGESKPVNVSRHPDNESDPKFSPDGKLLAFTGRRVDSEVDVYYVYLQEDQDEETSRQRTIQEAIELITKKRKNDSTKSEAKSDAPATETKPDDQGKAGKEKSAENGTGGEAKKDDKQRPAPKNIDIDFAGIHERVRKISIPNSNEGGLLFSPDGKTLAFSATLDGKRGWYTVKFPDELTPKLLTTSTGSDAVWTEKSGGILYLQNGVPAKLDPAGKLESYPFKIAQQASRSQWLQAGFDKAWLVMREVWYDERFANRNWDEIRRKYSPVAAEMGDIDGLSSVVELMLGELNGSHLGFTPNRSGREGGVEGWPDETAHLGVRFDPKYLGPGLRIRDVIPDGPADKEVSKLFAGDIILAIDGTPVDPAYDLTLVLNGRLDRDIRLLVKRIAEKVNREEATREAVKGTSEAVEVTSEAAEGTSEELTITLRPTSFSRARALLYDHWLQTNRESVAQASQGRLGYLHIRAMDMGSFYEFERQLYNVGYGREGLVIDVRDNGGGSTTDLLLTALTQPKHAITVPRGGGPGYPHDRAVFAFWSKPIIVLCNQNSYSNAEIFSHAIKTLGRGKIVGVQTAGGVVSTGAAQVNDVGTIRVPFRGWFLLKTGEDMEMNGCLPDTVVWPLPGELPQGIDKQLDKAVELLLEEVGSGETSKSLIYATQRE